MTNSKAWGVYDAENLKLVEGGFFTKVAAEDCADEWRENEQRPGGYIVRRQRADNTPEAFK